MTNARPAPRVPRATLLAVLAAGVGGASGCQYAQFLPFLKPQVNTGALGTRSTERGPAFGEEATGAAGDGARSAMGDDWGAYNGAYSAERWSPLAQINAANVGALRVACVAELRETVPMQSGPVVMGGTMYVTSAVHTWAFDAATCRLRWKHGYRYYPKPDYDLKVNRGVAYVATPDGPRVVRGSNDGRVYALDARSGEEVWNVLAGRVDKGETFPAAPVAWHGLVYIGNAGGDNFAVTGRVMALDARTGARVWSTELVPTAGPANETWPGVTDRVPRAGAATWSSYTLDTLAGLLYVPTGNAAPDFLGELRPGENRHSYSVVMIDVRGGELRGAWQILERDVHDWDVAAAPALVTTAGRREIVAVAGKDGHLYGLARDPARDSGRRIYATETTTIANADAPLTPQGTRFCPGVQGGTEWNGPAYSPATNLLYVGAVDWCTTVKVVPARKLKNKLGIPWTGSAEMFEPFGTMDPPAKARGWLTAIDADDGRVRWRHQWRTPLIAGVTATAGGLVFTADLAGHVLAFDARTGAERWRYDAGQPVGGGVVAYAVRGKQYLAVASGLDAPLTWRTRSSPARVIVFALP